MIVTLFVYVSIYKITVFCCCFFQVNFNEPLSLLQRITEEMQYAEVLDKAVNAQDTLEEMAYVGAFVTSPYAATAGLRANKPFNPLLGETFECDRRAELGWRCLFEQVSCILVVLKFETVDSLSYHRRVQ